MTRNHLFIGIAFVCAVGIAIGIFLSRNRSHRNRPVVSLSGIQVETLTGSKYALADLSEPILIVNFWASWCPPCAEELPSLLNLVRMNEGRIRVVAYSQDEDHEKMRNFLLAFGDLPKGFDVAWDRDGSIAKRFGVPKLPESFIFDRERHLARRVEGYDDWSTPGVSAYVRMLIAE